MVRDSWRGESTPAALAPRICASPDVFNQRGRRPWANINFVTAHDGFTLNDLVSYNEKHNEANGEENKDGHSHNRSWNHGAEGPSEDEAVLGLRKRQMKNILATLLLSQGTPMTLAGDEFARTQNGNNNAYCQDNELSWLGWKHDERAERLIRFVKRLTSLRHRFPILRQKRFLSGVYNEELGVKDVTWVSASGEEMSEAQWKDPHTRCFGMLLDGRAQQTGIKQRGSSPWWLWGQWARPRGAPRGGPSRLPPSSPNPARTPQRRSPRCASRRGATWEGRPTRSRIGSSRGGRGGRHWR